MDLRGVIRNLLNRKLFLSVQFQLEGSVSLACKRLAFLSKPFQLQWYIAQGMDPVMTQVQLTVNQHPLVVGVSEMRFDQQLPKHFSQAQRHPTNAGFEPAAYPAFHSAIVDDE